MKSLILPLAVFFLIAGWMFYSVGAFGNYYIKQGIYDGNPHTWIWHNGEILWSESKSIDIAEDSVYYHQLQDAKTLINKLNKP